MNTRTQLNLALLILVVISAVVMIYLPGLEKPAPPTALTTLSPDQVTRIQIQRPGLADIQLVKRGQDWIMTAPLALPANVANVDSLLGLTQTPSQQQFAARKQDLDKFKLATPRVRLRLNDTEIAFGDTEPLAQRRYVRIDDTVHLVNEIVYDKLIAAPTAWVSTALLPPASKLLGIDLPGLTLTKQADGHWSLTPSANETSMDSINTLVDEWTHAQALQVKPYETGSAEGKVLLHLQASKNPISFEILARTPELILARPDVGVQYHLPAELADRLLKLPAPPATTERDSTTSAETPPHVH
jgi:hypothetical protein